jgi:16S rRNA (cytosine1402-N4)-methyltransferase
MDPVFAHEPVMASEVVDLLSGRPPGVVVDLTIGAGGHAAALLAAHPHLALVGFDRDPDAVDAARRRLEGFGHRAAVHRGEFAGVEQGVARLRAAGPPAWPGFAGGAWSESVVGVLADLGVSSPQLDRPERGFSYRQGGALDMRMDPSGEVTAADIVNTVTYDDLVRMLVENGEARFGRRIARAIIAARPLATTDELAAVVAEAVPAPARRRGHPARRVFQALRIAVNEELDQLARGLPQALDLLSPGGRAVVISYHSGEDRLVKQIFRDAERGGCQCPPGLPCVCGAEPLFRLVFRGSRRPGSDEVTRNYRSESARLRAVERLPDPSPSASALPEAAA